MTSGDKFGVDPEIFDRRGPIGNTHLMLRKLKEIIVSFIKFATTDKVS